MPIGSKRGLPTRGREGQFGKGIGLYLLICLVASLCVPAFFIQNLQILAPIDCRYSDISVFFSVAQVLGPRQYLWRDWLHLLGIRPCFYTVFPAYGFLDSSTPFRQRSDFRT